MDDGNRQLSISLALSDEQFQALLEKLDFIASDADTNVATEVGQLRTELGVRLTAINESITQTSNNLGKWLAAIALAIANPADNTAEVQAHIDAITNQLKQQTDAVSAAVDSVKET